MKTTSIPQLFEAVYMAIYNTQKNEALQKGMSVYGYVPKRFQEGNALLEYARMMYNTQEDNYSSARHLSVRISQDCERALEVFKEHVSITKIAFRKETYVIQELKVSKIAASQWKWIQQAIEFYHKAGQYMDKLQQYGLTNASFEQNKAAVEALVEMKAQRLKKKGDAENSTEARNKSIKDLKAWYSEFRKIARIAFKDTPQILETYGITVRSSPAKTKTKEQV